MQLVMPFARATSYEPEDFLSGAANEQALSIIERYPDWPYSILYLHGAAGSGKTHLAHVFAKHSRATFIDPAQIGTKPADQLLVGNHAWVLDDLAAVTDEAALAQLINHVRARGDYLLLTARVSPTQFTTDLPDLRSRLLALPTTELGAPDDALLMGVLAKQFTDRQLRITPDVLTYASQQLERSYASVQQFVRAMDGLSLERGRAVTVPLVREALKNPGWQTP
jgi:chromosomal replication initiation ATPase DnaA